MVFQLLESESTTTHIFKCRAKVDRHRGIGNFVCEKSKTVFLPPQVYDVVATVSNIFAVLKVDESLKDMDDITKQAFAQKVHTQGRKLFICCLYMFGSMKFLHDMMDTAIFSDNSLPLPADVQNQYSLDGWNLSCIVNFERWGLTPCLSEGEYDREIADPSSLPIKTAKEQLGKGEAGVVYSIRIDKDCLTFPSAVHHGPSQGNVRHPNLAVCYTGFTALETRYFIADQADHDLQHTLTKTDVSDYQDFTRESLLAQFLGLARALEHIHNIAATGEAGYVHDIKPPNVLVFTEPALVFKLTDWSRAKISYLNGKNSHKTDTMGDNAYHPPECDEGNEEYLMPYDIWSIGCSFIDLMVWFNEGKKGYEKFLEARMTKPDPNDDSFHYFDETSKMKHSVTRKMEQLSSEESGWKDVAGIVEEMMVLNPEDRSTAAQLVERLRMVVV